MHYTILKNGYPVDTAKSKDQAHRTAEAWEEMHPDAFITIRQESN